MKNTLNGLTEQLVIALDRVENSGNQIADGFGRQNIDIAQVNLQRVLAHIDVELYEAGFGWTCGLE